MKYIVFFISIVAFSQQTKVVDFKTLHATLSLNANEKSINGSVTYDFIVKSNIDTIKIDAVKMGFDNVKINNQPVKYKNSGKHLCVFEGYKKGKNRLTFSYSAVPKQTLYFIGTGNDLQIWTQGQGKYTSNWLPSFDDVNEKVVFNLSISFDSNFTVLSNGILKNKTANNGNTLWNYQMKKPMSSYLVMLAIGQYNIQETIANSGVPLEFYLPKNNEKEWEPTYRFSKNIFDYLEKQIGVKYPWKIYRQVPVRDFLYAGMENTTSTIFSQDFVVDSIGFNDRNYVNVNAHELAHQWFGDLITATSSKHHWLQEGFATYYALLAEKAVFGEDYFYYQLYKNAQQLKTASKTDTIPILHEKASSLSYYQKGAWALHALRSAIGAPVFDKIVKRYLKKHQFKNVETDDFLSEINKKTNFDTALFKKKWLENPSFLVSETNELLKENKCIKQLFDIQSYRTKSLTEKRELFLEIIKSDAYFPIKTEIIYQIRTIPFEDKTDLIIAAMQSNSVMVRQAVAQTFSKIPLAFKTQYESLLADESYYTREIALLNLFVSFPEDQLKYLEISKNWVGGNALDLRITHLLLSQMASNYEADLKLKNQQELINYTLPKYESAIRQNAFQAILQLNYLDDLILTNLVNASTHFKWQFSKFAKDILKRLLKEDETRVKLENLIPQLSNAEKSQLQKLMN